MKNIEIEIIATNILDAKIIANSNANRIELIEHLDVGGLSPKQALLQEMSEITNVPYNVMVRTHANSFIYNEQDMLTMLKEIDYIRDHTNANGIVFGSLNQNNQISLPQLEQVLKIKGHLKLTYHRAIDEASNTLDSYQELTNYTNVDLVLTSGGQNSAIKGIKTIKKMLEIEPEQHCQILCGAGINNENIINFINVSHANRIHIGSAVRQNGLVNENLLNHLLKTINENTFS